MGHYIQRDFLSVSLLPGPAPGRLGVLAWVTALSPGTAWRTEGTAYDGEPGPSEELHSSPQPRPRRRAAGEGAGLRPAPRNRGRLPGRGGAGRPPGTGLAPPTGAP